jgi:hypothetical protein
VHGNISGEEAAFTKTYHNGEIAQFEGKYDGVTIEGTWRIDDERKG